MLLLFLNKINIYIFYYYILLYTYIILYHEMVLLVRSGLFGNLYVDTLERIISRSRRQACSNPAY